MEHLSYRKHFYWPGVVTFREILSILEANYPERIERVLIVRAPKIFPVGFNLLKHFMDEQTKEKIVVFGSEFARSEFAKFSIMVIVNLELSTCRSC